MLILKDKKKEATVSISCGSGRAFEASLVCVRAASEMETEETAETKKESPFVSRATQSPFCSRYERYVQLILKLQQQHLTQEQQRLQQQQQQQQQSPREYEPFPPLYVALAASLQLHAPPHRQQQQQQLSQLLQGWTFCMNVQRQSDGLLLLLQVALYTPGFVRLRLSEHPQQRQQRQKQHHKQKQQQHQHQQQRRPYAAELLLDPTRLQQLLVQRVETVATSHCRTIFIVNFEPPTIAAAAAAAAAKTEEAAAATAAAEEATTALQTATAQEQTVAAEAAGATRTAIAAAMTAAAVAAWTADTPAAADAAAATQPQPATAAAQRQPPEAATAPAAAPAAASASASTVAATVAATMAATARLQRATAATGVARAAAATAAEATAAAQTAAEAATAAAAATQTASLIAIAATAEATAAAATGPELDCSASDALSPEWLSHLTSNRGRGGAAAAAATRSSSSNNGRCQLAVVIHYHPFAVSIHSNGREVQRLNAQQLLNWEASSRSAGGQGSSSSSAEGARQQQQQQEVPKAVDAAAARRQKREPQGTAAADTAAATAAGLRDAVDAEPSPPLEACAFAAAPPPDVHASLSRELQRDLSEQQQQQLQQLLRAPLPELLQQSQQLLQRAEEERLHRRCSLGCDLFFADASGVYGLSEHSTAFKLTNCHEPYRFFNVDSYSWPLGSPSSLYASLPVLLATHTKKVQGAMLGTSRQAGPQASAFVLLNPTETFFRVDYDQPPQQQQQQQQQEQQQQQQQQGEQERHGIGCWFCSEGGAFEVLSCCGPSPADCYRQLHAALGLPAMQRISALGKQQSRWSYETQEEALEAMTGLDSARIPFDGLWLDIDYAPHCKYFEEDDSKFCLQSLAEQLQQQQRLLVLIADPHVRIDSEYSVFVEALRRRLVVTTGPSHTPFVGQSWGGYCVWPDFLRRDVRGWWSELVRSCLPSIPSRALGLWNDMNEPSVFGTKELTFPRKTLHLPDPPPPPPAAIVAAGTHADADAAAAETGAAAGAAAAAEASVAAAEHWEVHNVYGLLQQQASYAGLLARSPDKLRPFLLSRAGFLGSWRFGFLWTGDNEASWPHLRAVVPMVLAAAACGQSLTGADVGGFVGTCGAELLLRWHQLGVWLPLYRVHSDKASARREAFRDALTLPLVRDAVLSRYRMLPHWYTLCMEHALLGDPLIRPLWWLDAAAAAENCSSNPAAAAAVECSSSTQAFLVGSQVYVQPIVYPMASIEKSRATKQRSIQQQQQQQQHRRLQKKSVELALPRGYWWFDIETGAVYRSCHTYKPAAAGAAAGAADKEAAGGSTRRCLFPLTLRRIPVFVRGGCILAARETPRPSALLGMQEPITLHVYLSPEGVAEGRVYLDDGVSFRCREGRFLYVRFKARMQEQQQQPQQQQQQQQQEGSSKMRGSTTLQVSLESVTLPVEGPSSPWRLGALQAGDVPNACVSHVVVWGVCTPPNGALITRGSGEREEALPFATKELPLNPLEDELHIHRRAFVADAKTQPTNPPSAAAPVACAASAAEEAAVEGRQEQQQQLLHQQQQKQQQLFELQEEREALRVLLEQQKVEEELKQQQQQHQQLFGHAPFYRVVVSTAGALLTDCTWSVHLHW
ncbi:hypothetical protein Esti_001251 [Eimeria stiedai]